MCVSGLACSSSPVLVGRGGSGERQCNFSGASVQGPRCQYSYVGSVAAVELAGGMVRIKNRRFSPSTIDYDLHFDKWLTISDVQDADKVTANVPVTLVSFLRPGVFADVVLVYLDHEPLVSVQSPKTKRSHDKVSACVAASSVGAKFELVAWDGIAVTLETLLENLPGGSVLALRNVYKEEIAGGFRIVTSRCTEVVANPGGDEDGPASLAGSWCAYLVPVNGCARACASARAPLLTRYAGEGVVAGSPQPAVFAIFGVRLHCFRTDSAV